MNRLFAALMIASGAAALIYQITWIRNLSLVFGASYEATSVVLASFMGGLALGGVSIGRLSERVRRPLRAYGLFEIGIGLTALAVPSVFGASDVLHTSWVRSAGGETPELAVVRVVLCFAAVCVPTFLMGGTLPLVVKGLVDRERELGSGFAWLYGANTLGSAAGALATGFALIPALGVWHTQLTAVVLNVVVGVIALVLDRRSVESKRVEAFSAASPASQLPGEASGALRIAFWGTAVAGFCALALEVLWTRAITLAVGNTTYSVTVMLSAFLIGIWLGAWLRALFPTRRIGLASQMGIVMVVLGATAYATSILIPRLPVVMLRINHSMFGEEVRVLPATTLLVAFSVMLVPCVLMGIAFPLAVELRARLRSAAGVAVGDSVSANTLGSILGSMLAGFVLIPQLGLVHATMLVSAIYVVYGLLVLAAAQLAGGASRLRVGLAIGLASICIAAVPVAFEPSRLGVFAAFSNNYISRYADVRGQGGLEAQLGSARVLHLAHGRSATVAVVERESGRALLVNGKAVASDNLTDIPHELLLGHAPILMHPNPKRVLVVGLGAGVTLAAVLAHPDVEHVVVVEIESSVVDAAPFFGAANDDALSDPRVQVIVQDGRNFLKTTTDRFDVVTADPIHPWASGAGYLYTREYFALAAERLAEGGVLCQWIPGYELSDENFRSVAATIGDVFPEMVLWQTSQDGVVVAGRSRLSISASGLVDRLRSPRVAKQLGNVGLADPVDFASELVLDRDAAKRWAESAPVNTDDNLYLEFSSPLSIGASQIAEIARAIDEHRTGPKAHLDGVEEAGLSRAIERGQRAKERMVAADLPSTAPDPEFARTVERVRAVLDEFPDYDPARIRLADTLARSANAALATRRWKRARRRADESLELEPEQPLALHVRGVVALGELRAHDAIESLERAILLRPRHVASHRSLAEAYRRVGRTKDARRAATMAVEIESGVVGR